MKYFVCLIILEILLTNGLKMLMFDDIGFFSYLWNYVTITNEQLHQVTQEVKDQ